MHLVFIFLDNRKILLKDKEKQAGQNGYTSPLPLFSKEGEGGVVCVSIWTACFDAIFDKILRLPKNGLHFFGLAVGFKIIYSFSKPFFKRYLWRPSEHFLRMLKINYTSSLLAVFRRPVFFLEFNNSNISKLFE